MRCAIVGATGEVGRMMIRCLEEFRVPLNELVLLASPRSEGSKLPFNGQMLTVEAVSEKRLREPFDFILFSAGGKASEQYAPIAANAGNTVIDNSSAWRREPGIPLVVPEINGCLLDNYHGIVANPNCSTIQMVLALYRPAREFGLRKVVVSTYQSVSGAGHKGIATLTAECAGQSPENPFQKPIAFNVIPQIAEMMPDGYCYEEDKMRYETRTILGIPNLAVCATTVRVPTLRGHAESVYAEFEHPVNLERMAELLRSTPSVVFHEHEYITPVELGESNDSHVCRLRYGVDDHSVVFWNVGHNVRLGAATNAVRILLYMAAKRGLNLNER